MLNFINLSAIKPILIRCHWIEPIKTYKTQSFRVVSWGVSQDPRALFYYIGFAKIYQESFVLRRNISSIFSIYLNYFTTMGINKLQTVKPDLFFLLFEAFFSCNSFFIFLATLIGFILVIKIQPFQQFFENSSYLKHFQSTFSWYSLQYIIKRFLHCFIPF